MQKTPTGIGLLTNDRINKSVKPLIGLLPGEGVGPELIQLCRTIVESLNVRLQVPIELRTGGLIGIEAIESNGRELTDEVIDFCKSIFAEGGTILAGPGGGRFVYESRSEFDLFVKMNPLRVLPELSIASRLKLAPDTELDIMVIRDNCQGLYQGKELFSEDGESVSHTYGHSKDGVKRVIKYAVQVASARRCKLTLIGKRGGIPETTKMWVDCAEEIIAGSGVELRFLDMDFASYQLLRNPEEFDVIVVSNCFGDILADLGGLLMGSRGNTYGASFDQSGNGIYQTNHGSAYDFVGTDRVNPAGQILSLALLLRESLHMDTAADCLELALRQTWQAGWVTPDLEYPGSTVVGTKQMGQKVLQTFTEHLGEKLTYENIASCH